MYVLPLPERSPPSGQEQFFTSAAGCPVSVSILRGHAGRAHVGRRGCFEGELKTQSPGLGSRQLQLTEELPDSGSQIWNTATDPRQVLMCALSPFHPTSPRKPSCCTSAQCRPGPRSGKHTQGEAVPEQLQLLELRVCHLFHI